tara:strand:- start:1182 stop:1514 length:333 start_codon:yes stop_codon:yes gene_type:complete
LVINGFFFFIDLVYRDWPFFVDDVKYYKTLNQWSFSEGRRSEFYRVTDNKVAEEYYPDKGWSYIPENYQFKRKVGRKRARLITNLNDMYSVEQMIELVEVEKTEMFIEML